MHLMTVAQTRYFVFTLHLRIAIWNMLSRRMTIKLHLDRIRACESAVTLKTTKPFTIVHSPICVIWLSIMLRNQNKLVLVPIVSTHEHVSKQCGTAVRNWIFARSLNESSAAEEAGRLKLSHAVPRVKLGVLNHIITTPWPKAQRAGKASFATTLYGNLRDLLCYDWIRTMTSVRSFDT